MASDVGGWISCATGFNGSLEIPVKRTRGRVGQTVGKVPILFISLGANLTHSATVL